MQFNEKSSVKLRGDVWMKIGKDLTREQILENPDRQFPNLIVDICSELIAEWAMGGGGIVNPDIHVPGILTLAVGTGDVGWDLQNPPAETADLTVLYAELFRKEFSLKTYVDGAGDPSPTRTNIIDLTTTYLEAEAVGPLVEMGLFGGTGSLNVDGGLRVNAKHFPVINKPATASLAILWRLTF